MTSPPSPTDAPVPDGVGHTGHREGAAGTRASAPRARPLPPAERRAALIEATLPLVSRYGARVTTRQIAESAGVAEGTIFRVFPDKESLISAAITVVMDPEPIVAEIDAVDSGLPLAQRLAELTKILQRRLLAITNLLIAVGRHHYPQPDDCADERQRHPTGTPELIDNAIVAQLTPDQERFRFPVREVVRLLRMLTLSGTHPTINDGEQLTAEQITSILLDGVLRRPAH